MVSPSEARDYRPVDPSSEYQDYYGLPPPPSPVRPPFQFSVTYGPRPPFPLFGDPFARPTMGFPFPDFDAPPFPTAPGAFRQYPPPPGPPPDLFSLLGFPPGFGPAFGIPAHDPSDPVAQRVAQGMPASYEELMSLAERMGGGGPRGASREVIDGLPRVPAPAAAAQSKGKEKPGGEGGSASASGGSSSSSAGGAAGSEERQTSCPVCLGAFGEEPGEQLVVLPKCLHKYHEPCAIAALERDRRCPVCRVDV
ncbi:hypothetical protein DFJ74DRAFT_667827 [Hyaloraphidium curvatum]|nr:hypothetical protein DFJ74DRAFT_667827 [Hyaloraphidium curvatum]